MIIRHVVRQYRIHQLFYSSCCLNISYKVLLQLEYQLWYKVQGVLLVAQHIRIRTLVVKIL